MNNLIFDVLEREPFSLNQNEKNQVFLELMQSLTAHHLNNSDEFNGIFLKLNAAFNWDLTSLDRIPFIPVRLFKELELMSVSSAEVFKIMNSSGTSGQAPSKIFLDRNTAKLQTQGLTKLVKNFLGPSRLPLLIIDSESTISNRLHFSARAAGILGFMPFGREVTYALNHDLSINYRALREFIAKHKTNEIFIFGFTSIIWQFLQELKQFGDETLVLPNSSLVHGGGWKKLIGLGINNETFKSTLHDTLGVERVINYYGLVEQTGSLFFECTSNYLHVSNFSNVIIRNPTTFELLPIGETGALQLQSIFPISYPGHSILTEDLAKIEGVDDCKCGRFGQRLSIIGRIPAAEVRGCSDTLST